MAYPLTMARKNCYGGTRALSAIRYIVLHYTGVNGDTAKNEVKYFSTSHTGSSGAHFFVGQDGDVQQSIPMKYIAWSVGDWRNGHGPYYSKCKNSNSVSIEMCDQMYKDASAAQIAAVKKLIAYIKSQCPNIVDVIRHHDVTTKSCPARYLNSAKWQQLKAAVTGGTYTIPDHADTVTETLAVDGYVGYKTVFQWQRIMGTAKDGEISNQMKSTKKYHLNFTSSAIEYFGDPEDGSQLIKAVQRLLGCDDDGWMGPKTIKAIQTHLGVYADGYFGSQTARALQTRLNTGKF